MRMLGSHQGGVLVLRGDVVLPLGEERLTYKRNRMDIYDVMWMLDNPHEKAYCFLLPEDGFDYETYRTKSVGMFVEVSQITVNDEDVELNVTGNKRVSLTGVVPDASGVVLYCMDYKEIKMGLTRPDEVFGMAKEIINEFKEQAEIMKDVKQIGENMSNLADYFLFGMTTDYDKVNEYLGMLSIYKRMKEAHMATFPERYKPGNKDGNDPKKLTAKNEDVKELIDQYYAVESKLNEKANKEIYTALKSLTTMSPQNGDFTKLVEYVRLSVELPWDGRTTDNDIKDVEKDVNESHYGMDKAKERIMEYLAIRKLNPDSKGTVLLLNGPPGTGKTTLAQSIAKAMGRKCERISLGGCNDSSFIKGHSRTYVGAKSGRIIAAMNAAGVKNPVLILDEVEKVTAGSGGDPEGAMLELLDPNQNTTFTDTYLGYGFDMSEVLFICTSNDAHLIYPALKDRMETINLEGYTMTEKVDIATKYVIPKKAENLGIPGTKISKGTIKSIIEGYTREPGVRGLEKAVDNLLRKVAVEKSKGKDIKVTKTLMKKRLGLPYEEEKPDDHRIPGLVSGLYYSADGGGCLDLEGVVYDKKGSGKLEMTGKLGDVMRESLNLVHSHMTAKQHEYGCSIYDLKNVNLHVHVPSGSTPKDGPSAGAAFSLLLASLASNYPVRPRLAMTGECTLTGRITAIGGVDQKCAGAVRMGMEHIILPKANKRDYDMLPAKLKKAATYYFVTTVAEVIDIGLNYEEIEDAQVPEDVAC